MRHFRTALAMVQWKNSSNPPIAPFASMRSNEALGKDGIRDFDEK
jgi:hypothetical protein